MLMVVLVRMMVMVVVAMMVMNTSKGSLCNKGEPVSWSKLLRHNHFVHHTNSKHCDALVTIMMTMMLTTVVMTVTCSLESMARQVRTATQRIERTPTFLTSSNKFFT